MQYTTDSILELLINEVTYEIKIFIKWLSINTNKNNFNHQSLHNLLLKENKLNGWMNFMMGYIHENFMNQFEEAEEYYDQAHLQSNDYAMVIKLEKWLNCPVEKWSKLIEINLTKKKIKYLPAEVGNWQAESIYLSHNQLRSLPKTVGNWPAQKIYLSSNQLASLPDEVGNWSAHSINLFNNQLTVLPESVGNWKAVLIDLANNQLIILPESVGNWKADFIYLLNNQLTSFPKSVKNWKAKIIYLSNNSLETKLKSILPNCSIF